MKVKKDLVYFDYNVYDDIGKGYFEVDCEILREKFNIQISVAIIEEYYKAWKHIKRLSLEGNDNGSDKDKSKKLLSQLEKTRNAIKKLARNDVILEPDFSRVRSKKDTFENRLKVVSSYDTTKIVDNNATVLNHIYKSNVTTLNNRRPDTINYSNLSDSEIWKTTELQEWIRLFKDELKVYKREASQFVYSLYGVQANKVIEKTQKLEEIELEEGFCKKYPNISFGLLEFIFEYLDKGLQRNGYNRDKDERRVQSGIHDVSHAIYATYCNYFVTSDKRAAKRIKAIYSYLGIKTEVITTDDFLKGFVLEGGSEAKIKVIIMAGGKGSRISSLFPEIPKPLIQVESADGQKKPVLQWEIESLISQGYKDIILTVSYLHEQIEEYFGNGSRLGCRIQYFVEEQPLGNAGALFKLQSQLEDSPFLLLNADSVFNVDFNRMLEFHKKNKASVTLLTHPNSHPYDSGLLITALNGSVEKWLTKEENRPEWYRNIVNAGLHIMSPDVLDQAIKDGRVNPNLIGKEIDDGNGGKKIYKVDLDRQILKPLCGTGKMYSYLSPEYVKDMGTPERYEQVSNDFSTGIVEARNLSNKQKAIFLDRDGTINKYVGFLRNIDDFELLPGVTEAVRLINNSGYLCIVTTNQPVIARGEVTTEELDTIHKKMETLLGLEGAYIDALYYCPHHPDKGYAGEITELKIDCECRKPKPGMLIRAAEDYNICLEESWIIGDGQNDIECGMNAGCHTAYLRNTFEDIDDIAAEKADITASSLLEAVKRILR